MALAVGATGCTADGDPTPAGMGDDPTTVTRDETTVSTTPPTPSTTATPASPVPNAPTAFTDQARDAVNELKAAWEDGDRDRMAAIAPADVVKALMAIPPGGFEVYGCDTGEFDTSTCNLRNRSTGLYITVNSQRHDQGWQIATIYVDAG